MNQDKQETTDTNLTNNETQESSEDRITRLDERIIALENELTARPNDNDDDDGEINISESISGYRESEDRINTLETEMDRTYGTRLRSGLRRQQRRTTVPSKF